MGYLAKVIGLLICMFCLMSIPVMAGGIADYVWYYCRGTVYWDTWTNQEYIQAFHIHYNWSAVGVYFNVTQFYVQDGIYNVSIYDQPDGNSSNLSTIRLLGTTSFNSSIMGNVKSMTLNFTSPVNLTANTIYFLMFDGDNTAFRYQLCTNGGRGLYYGDDDCVGCPNNYGWYFDPYGAPPEYWEYWPNDSRGDSGLAFTLKYYTDCEPNWSCVGYNSSCIDYVQLCNNVTDSNSCSIVYSGDYSEFSRGCGTQPTSGGGGGPMAPGFLQPTTYQNTEPVVTPTEPIATEAPTATNPDNRKMIIGLGIIITATLLIVIALISTINTTHRRKRR